MRTPEPLARELRELIAHGCPQGRTARLDEVLRGLLKRVEITSTVPLFNAREEVMAVLMARRTGVEIEDQTAFQELVQSEIDSLLAQAGIEALARVVARCKRKPPRIRRPGRPASKTDEEQRQDRFAARSQATEPSAAVRTGARTGAVRPLRVRA